MGAEAGEGRLQVKSDPELLPNPNRITIDQFLSWKRRKEADASATKAEAERKRAEDIDAGLVQMNGRELFSRQPWLFDNNLY